MIGILVVAHGSFGEALIHCATHVLGKRPQLVRDIGVGVRDDPDAVLPRAQALVRELDDGAGVLVLSDMVGATPSNIAARLAEPGRIEVVSGVSLPMLVRVLTYRNEGLGVAVEKALSGGREGVVHVSGAGGRAAA